MLENQLARRLDLKFEFYSHPIDDPFPVNLRKHELVRNSSRACVKTIALKMGVLGIRSLPCLVNSHLRTRQAMIAYAALANLS